MHLHFSDLITLETLSTANYSNNGSTSSYFCVNLQIQTRWVKLYNVVCSYYRYVFLHQHHRKIDRLVISITII